MLLPPTQNHLKLLETILNLRQNNILTKYLNLILPYLNHFKVFFEIHILNRIPDIPLNSFHFNKTNFHTKHSTQFCYKSAGQYFFVDMSYIFNFENKQNQFNLVFEDFEYQYCAEEILIELFANLYFECLPDLLLLHSL